MRLRDKSIYLTQTFGFKQLFMELVAFVLILTFFASLAYTASHMSTDVKHIVSYDLSLSPSNIPYYAFMTTMRIFIAALFSIIFAFIVATAAAKYKKAEEIIIPLIDILQSIPILGYISFSVTIFISLSPHKALGVEAAVIFAIFTSQAWNITFSLYQSLKTTPRELLEASTIYGLSPWKKFWFVEVPFAAPGLIWNVMMSVSGSWFFIVASEIVSVGDIQYTLPGIGSYLGLAIYDKNIHAVLYSILTTLILIIIYDNLLFRPALAWADKFKYELVSTSPAYSSWVLNLFKKSVYAKKIFKPLKYLIQSFIRGDIFDNQKHKITSVQSCRRIYNCSSDEANNYTIQDYIWYCFLAVIIVLSCIYTISFIKEALSLYEVLHVFTLGLITLIRILLLISFVSFIWIPVGIFIGLRPNFSSKVQPIIQFIASFPANLLFPVFVAVIIKLDLNPNIWLSPLIVLGTQWYILFNVIAGTNALPRDLLDAAASLGVRRILLLKKVILPGIFPYLLTGVVTAVGGAWNASIIAEAVNWGTQELYAVGLGAYIAEKTTLGDYNCAILGICVMSLYVALFNKLVWHPLYKLTEKRLHSE
jgi:NitT/TauT family transport system permease protein